MFPCSSIVVLLTVTFKSDEVLYCNTIISSNTLVLDDAYPASRGAGFINVTSHASVNYGHSHAAPLGGGGLPFVFVFLRACIKH